MYLGCVQLIWIFLNIFMLKICSITGLFLQTITTRKQLAHNLRGH